MQDMRIMVFDRLDTYLFDVDFRQVRNATYVTEINGEHSLTIETTQELEKTNRLLLRDGMGIWHEYVVLGIEESHDAKEYYCVWSLQYDLAGTFINGPYDCGIVPGHASIPQLPRRALEVSLGSTERWEIGTITVTTMGAASFYRRSGWEGLKTVLEVWGGELQATITVGSTGVVTRAVDLLAHVGASDATRRFDYGYDLKGIKRTISDDVWPCRIVPLGKSQETENGGYTRRPDISSVNGNVMWLQDDTVVAETRILNPNGEYEYPTVIVENDTYEQPADLKAWALEHITEYTRPKVTYTADVVQLARAGMSAHGVALGDNVAVVDRTFGTDGLRIAARVTKISGSLLDPADTTLTIGNMYESLSNQFENMSRQVSSLTTTVERSQAFQATAEYVSNLIGRLNGEANATGGYTYITEGEGIRTYDVPVSDPLIGAEASMVVEIRGGNIRIANSRTSGGDWDFKTLIQSGYIGTELLTASNITTGVIGNASGNTYWDLDNNILVIGGSTAQDIADDISDAAKVATNYLTYDSATGLDIGYSGTSAKTRINGSGMEVFDGGGTSVLFAGLENSKSLVRVGKQSNSGNAVMSSDGYVDLRRGTTVLAHFGYGSGASATGTAQAPYYDIGVRKLNTTVGNYSVAEGYNATASGYTSHAEGAGTTASGITSHAEGSGTTASATDSHAEGDNTTASGYDSHAEGYYTTASAQAAHAEGYHCVAESKYSHAAGYYTVAAAEAQTVIGKYNVRHTSRAFQLGNGTSDTNRSTTVWIGFNGNAWIAGTLTQGSDRRLKEHHAYLGEDACEFVRQLKPALYTKDGKRHVGFYAQDVQEAEPEGWDTVTVTEEHTDDALGFDPLALDYTALIAPLVAYVQQLERRIEQLEGRTP